MFNLLCLMIMLGNSKNLKFNKMIREIIIDNIEYTLCPKEKDWEILQTGYIKGNNGEPDKEYIHSIKKISNDEIFTIGDTIALTWYPTFITPLIIKEFVIKNNEMCLRYEDKAYYILRYARKVTKEEISEAINNYVQIQKKFENFPDTKK